MNREMATVLLEKLKSWKILSTHFDIFVGDMSFAKLPTALSFSYFLEIR